MADVTINDRTERTPAEFDGTEFYHVFPTSEGISYKTKLGTAAPKDAGTAADELPTNSDRDGRVNEFTGDNEFTGANHFGGAVTGIKMPSFYARSRRWKIVDNTTNRTVIRSPDIMYIDVNNEALSVFASTDIDIDVSGSWDTVVGTDYTTAANRAGEDFYIYACEPASGTTPDFVLSANSTIPDGYTATNSRKVGQFHCLCEDVLTNVYPYENEGNDEDYVAAAYVNSSLSNGDTQHWMEGMITGDILPFSVQDILHRPHDGATREGATFSPKDNRWGMIYLPSWDAAKNRLVSRYGAIIADGVSSPAFHASRFDQALGGVGYMSINRQEFVNMSLGSPQGVNILGSADPNTTGGHAATNGQRIVSLIGMEDMTGVMYQWSRETTENSRSLWGSGFDSNDKNVAGEDFSLPFRSRFGLRGDVGSESGSRGAFSNGSALYLHSDSAGRGVAEPCAGRA
jgi:hypothetical protein